MTTLCLIIDSIPDESWREAYEVHRQIWNAVLDKNPEVKGYFLRSDPSIPSDHFVDGRFFVTRGQERYTTILDKTLKAVEVLLGDYDYVLRTNLSSLFDFPLLLQMDLPKEKLYAGSLIMEPGITFVSGSGMILSRDVAKALVSTTRPPAFSPCDDVAIAQILASGGIQPTRLWDRYDYNYNAGEDQVTGPGRYVQYRLREDGSYRAREPLVTRQLFAKIYP